MVTDDKPSGGKNSFLKGVAFIFLSIMVLVSAFLAYTRSRGIDIEEIGLRQSIDTIFSFDGRHASSGVAGTIGFDIKNDTWLGVCRDYIVIYRNDRIIGIDENGNKKWEIPMTMHNPCASSSGHFMVAADLGGNTLCMIKGKNLIWENTLDREIVNVSVNSAGYVAVVAMETDGYRSKVIVIDPAGVEIFTRKIAERYIIDSVVSPDNKEVAINTLDTGGMEAETGIEFTTVLGKHIAGVKPDADCIFPYLDYLDEGYLAMAGPTAIACFDKGMNIFWTRQCTAVYSATVLDGRLVAALADRKDGHGASIVVESHFPDGTRDWTFDVNDKVVNIKAYDDIIGVNTGREIIFLRNGKLVDKFASMSDIVDISFINKAKTVVVTRNDIKVYHLSTDE